MIDVGEQLIARLEVLIISRTNRNHLQQQILNFYEKLPLRLLEVNWSRLHIAVTVLRFRQIVLNANRTEPDESLRCYKDSVSSQRQVVVVEVYVAGAGTFEKAVGFAGALQNVHDFVDRQTHSSSSSHFEYVPQAEVEVLDVESDGAGSAFFAQMGQEILGIFSTCSSRSNMGSCSRVKLWRMAYRCEAVLSMSEEVSWRSMIMTQSKFCSRLRQTLAGPKLRSTTDWTKLQRLWKRYAQADSPLPIYNQTMNFLNKKYTSLHGTAPYHSNSRSFLPSPTALREETRPSTLSSNNCDAHPSELVRHLCLECVELLCAECIGDHLELHREANVIPKIQSIKQVRAEMEDKLEHISALMNGHSPAHIDVEGIRRKALDKIDEMRKDIVRAVDEWVAIMRSHLLSSLGFDEMGKVKTEMEKLYDEVRALKAALQSGSQAGVVKKVYQIDGEKLEKGYSSMFQQYREMQIKSDFEFAINWKEIIKSFEAHINLKPKTDILENREDLQQESKHPSIDQSRQSSKQPSYQGSVSSRSERSEDMKIYDLRQ